MCISRFMWPFLDSLDALYILLSHNYHIYNMKIQKGKKIIIQIFYEFLLCKLWLVLCAIFFCCCYCYFKIFLNIYCGFKNIPMLLLFLWVYYKFKRDLKLDFNALEIQMPYFPAHFCDGLAQKYSSRNLNILHLASNSWF